MITPYATAQQMPRQPCCAAAVNDEVTNNQNKQKLKNHETKKIT
jgi:hypothetical protein